MNAVYRFSWLLWIIGTALIAGSWLNAVPFHIGWVGFGIALAGTLLSMAASKLGRAAPATRPSLCGSCRLHHADACWRPERPNAEKCPDYQRASG